jgi:hypothetical protein
MKNMSGKSCRENQNTHFMLGFFFFENLAVYENVEKYGTTRQVTDNMAKCRVEKKRFAC